MFFLWILEEIEIIFQQIWVNELLEKYVKRIYRPDLIGENNIIVFTFIAKKIHFGEQTKVESFFQDSYYPSIKVHMIAEFCQQKKIFHLKQLAE